jgi:hypothetical protein
LVSKTEQSLSRSLREILLDLAIADSIADSEQWKDVLIGLEHFVPGVLQEIHPECDSWDGILPQIARKTGDGELEILGYCILISDQTIAPVQICLQLAPAEDEITWLICRMGERGSHGLVRTPYDSVKHWRLLKKPFETLDWAYQVTFGERRS